MFCVVKKSCRIYKVLAQFSISHFNFNINFSPYGNLQKANLIKNNFKPNKFPTKNFSQSIKHSDNLGKIICLDESELEINTERLNRRNKRKLKTSTITLEKEDEKDIDENIDEDIDEENTVSLIRMNEKNVNTKSSRNDEILFLNDFAVTNITTQPALLHSIMGRLKSKKYREESQQIILEGKRLVNDALCSGQELLMLFFNDPSDIKNMNLPINAQLYKCKYKDLKLWSDLVTPPGVIGVFKMPRLNVEKKNSEGLPLSVICDNIREPGNLGSILRVVSSVGCKGVFLTKGCVDIWEPKVLRSACGSHFRLKIIKNLTWTEIENEIPSMDQIILADSNSEGLKNMENQSLLFKSQTSNKYNLPLTDYSVQEYSSQGVVIVIGGETHGLSEEAYQFAEKRKGARVYIPMSNNVESLNSGVALGILSYEVRRQLKPHTDTNVDTI